jgi:polyphosphate kinase
MNDAPSTAAENASAITWKGLQSNAWQDRDSGWLAFNQRVLNEALDERTPLLERLKFLGIVTSNLDEFFMKRVSPLRAKVVDHDDPWSDPADWAQGLARIRESVTEMLEQQARCYLDVLLPALAEHGIKIAAWIALTDSQREEAGRYFDSNVSAALTPLGFDPAHPFPFMSNLSTNWTFVIRADESLETTMVRVKIPPELPAWVEIYSAVAKGERVFLSMEELIRHQAETKLLPGMSIVSATLFRILRNAEMTLAGDDGDDLRELISDALLERRFKPVVRVDFAEGADPAVRRALMERFALSEDDVFVVSGLLDYPDLYQIAALDMPELRDPAWIAQMPARLGPSDGDIFDVIDAGDILLHHPYESFDASVERFIAEAADDPRTLAIKMTVYRVGDDTPFVRSLIRAAEAGKQVACVIEIQARFDEARNLHWARLLTEAGAHVTYGVVHLKTHTKIALVVQRRGTGLRCYAHIATGNYHVKTARIYADVGLLTSDPAITADVVNLMHYLTGHSKGPALAKLLVAPINMRERFVQMIEREVAHHVAGRPTRIVAKLNQVDDPEICVALARASRAGVPIDLIVRGFCCLRPGVPGWTEGVRVRSIVGRFLEHSRIFYFANGQTHPLDGEFLIGSADWMHRNLSRRVEAAAPIADRALRAKLWEILEACLDDSRQAWEMGSDGSYVQRSPPADGDGVSVLGLHRYLSQRLLQRAG